MFRFRFLTLAAVLVGAAIFWAPSRAQAAFEIYLQQDGGAITKVGSGADFTAASFTGPFGFFQVNIFGSSSDNGAALSDLLASTTSVKNNDSSSHTLALYSSQTGYSLPAGSLLTVESGLGGSVNSGTISGTGVFQAYASNKDTLLDMTDFTNGPQTATASGSTFDTGSATGLFNRTNPTYSLTSVATFTVSGGGQGNFSSHVNVTATPAPAGVVLALTALPALGIGSWLRRRKVKAQNS